MRVAFRTLAMLLCYLGFLGFGVVLAKAKPSPMDRVHAYAGSHAVTVARRNGYWFVEEEGSDIFGTGKTVREAAEDFLADADLEAHETNRPDLQRVPVARVHCDDNRVTDCL